jgi:hypothetical protein
MELKFKPKNSPDFELVLQVKDHNGLSTGKTKSIKTDDVVALHSFFVRNTGHSKKKKRHKTDAAPAKDVKKILQDVNKYIDTTFKQDSQNQ